MPTKTEIGVGAAIAIYLLASGKKSSAATLPAHQGGAAGTDESLLRRADQASEWVSILVYDLGIPEAEAAADARWFGIESSGVATATSSQGERGLAQITKTSALTEKALTQAEWDAMASVTTSEQEQARIALKVIAWCYVRASKYIKVPPIDPIEHIWYAKLYHQSPVDVRDAKLTGDAFADAARLEKTWANDAKRLHYLHAANVVAWGSIQAPTGAANS